MFFLSAVQQDIPIQNDPIALAILVGIILIFAVMVIRKNALAKKAAKDVGKESMSAQAVGGAVGHNPISIIIPCHRILGSNGSLTGYAGGIEAKKYLLALEGILRVG